MKDEGKELSSPSFISEVHLAGDDKLVLTSSVYILGLGVVCCYEMVLQLPWACFLLFLVWSLCLKSMLIICFLDGLTEDRLTYNELQFSGHSSVGGCMVCM